MINLMSDKDIEKLKEAKQLLQDIRELDSNFSLSNIIQVDNNTKLIFSCSVMCKEEYIKETEEKLIDRLRLDCIVLPNNFKLEKAIQKESIKVDYKTETFYTNGEVIREVTTQYK